VIRQPLRIPLKRLLRVSRHHERHRVLDQHRSAHAPGVLFRAGRLFLGAFHGRLLDEATVVHVDTDPGAIERWTDVDVGLSEGRVFNRSLINTVERELQLQYYSLGYYDVTVESTVSPLPRNRVSIRIDISEGEPASIQEIHLTGNRSYDADTLRDQFQLGPRAWWALFGTSDRYSRPRLGGDLESLRSFYLNRGYINYDVTSTQVSIDPRRREIFIGVNLDEGEQYTVSEVKLAGEFVVPESELRDLATLEAGELYSRQEVTAVSEAIKARLGEEGYAFANVNPVPDVNEQDRTVAITFFIDPAERVYVRRVNIDGNERTQDRVIRREMRQMEGGWLSTEKVRQSRRRLNRLGFFEQVNIETPRVPGSDDQVDVDVGVTERLSGSLQAGVGYGSDRGLILNTSVQQDNVLGTGDRIGISASDDDVTTVYSLSYKERYASIDGVSRTYSAVYRRTRADAAYISNYRIDQSRLGIEYGIPLEEEEQINVGLQYEYLGINLGDEANTEQEAFVDRHGENFGHTVDVVVDRRRGLVCPPREHVTLPAKGLRHREEPVPARHDVQFDRNRRVAPVEKRPHGGREGSVASPRRASVRGFATGVDHSRRAVGPTAAGRHRRSCCVLLDRAVAHTHDQGRGRYWPLAVPRVPRTTAGD
jgi:outer membrane protein assembly complex protein YaeT